MPVGKLIATVPGHSYRLSLACCALDAGRENLSLWGRDAQGDGGGTAGKVRVVGASKDKDQRVGPPFV